ncbi:unnamed protein product [Echinostoma caproni]|uniref:Iron-containing alcohol dehydrogenase n=1 Tax=Echinostoma caproni TaxID=27848 RepID=A0A183A3X1_9TREM|nr:unnamed protein product [Echinostoma caproni]
MEFFTKTLERSGYNPMAVQLTQPAPDAMDSNTIDWFRVEAQGAVLIDCPSLLGSSILEQKLPDLKQILCDHQESGVSRAQQCDLLLNCLGLAIHTLCYNAVYRENGKSEFFKGSFAFFSSCQSNK